MSDARPNILLVMTDQHRGDCLGQAGHPDLLTPHLDALARGGAFFTRGYSECPVCIPARHALMTGKSPQTTGVTGFAECARIANEDETLPNLLRRAGYQTASVGRSMHTYPHYRRYGFETVDHHQDRFYRDYPETQPLSSRPGVWRDWPHLQHHGLGPNGYAARPWPFEEPLHETNSAVRKAINFLDHRDRESPFFLYVGTVAPHPPLVPPACYYDRYDRPGLRAPAVGIWVDTDACPLHDPPTVRGATSAAPPRVVLGGPQLQSTLAGYYGLINHFDDQLNLLLTRLETEGLRENTLVIFTSDHGEMLGDHHCFRKSMPYEGSAHVPFLVSGPGIAAHTRVDTPVVLMDILPTCCEAAGVDVPGGVEGRSVLPLTRGEQPTRAHVHGTHGAMTGLHDGFHFLTDGHLKYIWWVGDGREQLFDLDADPKECDDLTATPAAQDTLEDWRAQLVHVLADAPERFVRGRALVAGVSYGETNERAMVDTGPSPAS